MIESIGNIGAQQASLRLGSRGEAVAQNFDTSSEEAKYVSSRIRMDNLLDLAILEFRSAETGDVIRQFPTERQIAAFQQAAELDTSQEERSFEQAESFSPVQATNAQSEIAPIVTPIATPSPSPSISTSYSASGGGEVSQSPSGGETTQSILV